MFDDAWTEPLVKVLLIVAVAVASYIAIRLAVAAGVRHLIARRAGDVDTGNLKRVELERRITTLGQLVVKIAAGVIVVMATLMVLGVFNVDIGPAIAALGIAGLAVGFGAQTLIKDWLSGVFIVAENQFNAGEQVRIAGVEGEVEDFSLRRTVLRDADGTVHHVPNGQIIVASNLSRGRHAPQAGLGFGARQSAPDVPAGAADTTGSESQTPEAD